MPISDDHKRQISQFALIANAYLQLGAEAASYDSETFGMTKASFHPSGSITDKTKRLAMLSAHLSSAAIRFVSIEEVLRFRL